MVNIQTWCSQVTRPGKLTVWRTGKWLFYSWVKSTISKNHAHMFLHQQKNNISPFSLLNLPIWLTGAKRREFLEMIHWLTINFIIPATPSNPSIPYVKRTSKLGGSQKFSWDPWDAKRCTRVTVFFNERHTNEGGLLPYPKNDPILWLQKTNSCSFTSPNWWSVHVPKVSPVVWYSNPRLLLCLMVKSDVLLNYCSTMLPSGNQTWKKRTSTNYGWCSHENLHL